MRQISGLALIAIALLHCLIGLFLPGVVGFAGVWQEIWNAGMIDAAKPDSLRIWSYYWFLASGLFLMLCGFLCYWIEHQLKHPLPSAVGWGLLIIASLGIVLDLDTGFWLVLLVAVNAIAASSRALPTDQSDVAQPQSSIEP